MSNTSVRLYLGYGIEHQCRVVVIVDYLSDDELLGLFRATTFYVNTSRAEGACLPLQQALACGRPAIAPAHTAMADYMDDRVGFVVASHPEPTHWPHDPQKRIKTSWQRLDWSSLRDQYLRSAELAGLEPRGIRGDGRVRTSSHEELRQRRRGHRSVSTCPRSTRRGPARGLGLGGGPSPLERRGLKWTSFTPSFSSYDRSSSCGRAVLPSA